jgi:hypothetical protein
MTRLSTTPTSPSTALVPYTPPLVALITPNAALSRATVMRLLEDGHDIASIAVFHNRAGRMGRSGFRLFA